MKTIAALAFLFCLSGTLANAQVSQSQMTVTCGNTLLVLKSFDGKDINEHPIWVGTAEATNTRTVVLVNKDTQNWSIVQFDNKIACVLGVGQGYMFKVMEELK